MPRVFCTCFCLKGFIALVLLNFNAGAEQRFHLVPISGWVRKLDSDTMVPIDEMGALSKGFHHKYHKYDC